MQEQSGPSISSLRSELVSAKALAVALANRLASLEVQIAGLEDGVVLIQGNPAAIGSPDVTSHKAMSATASASVGQEEEELAILSALARLKAFGTSSVKEVIVAAVAHQRYESREFKRALARLVDAGIVSLSHAGVRLRASSAPHVQEPRPTQSVTPILERVIQQLGSREAQVLRVVSSKGGAPISDIDIASLSGVKGGLTAVRRILSSLIGQGLVSRQGGEKYSCVELLLVQI